MSEDRLITLKDLSMFKREIIQEVSNILIGKVEKRWLKSKEVRKMLDLSGGKLQYLRNKNKITFSKIGRTVYYLESDVHAMLEKNTNKHER